MKRFFAFIASRILYGFFGFYLLAGFIVLSFGLGLLMKFGVLRTPGVVKDIADFVGRITWQTTEYVIGILIHLAANPLDLIFTLLAAFFVGRIAYSVYKTPPSQPYQGPKNLPLRGTSIQHPSVIQHQLAERRRRAQAQLEEQYTKFTVL